MPKSTSDCCATGSKRLWPKVRLGDVCEVQRGGSPRPIKDYITDSPEGLNWIKIGDVEPTGKYITQTAEKIKPSGLNKTRKVSAGDFLLSNSMSFGRPYILKIDGCIHDGWLVLKEFSKTFTEDFFYYLLRSPVVQEQFDKLAHGSTVRNLNTDAVSRVSLPLPPLAEQKKIVEKVEKALKRVDALKAQFERMEKSAADYFKAALAETFAAVKGEKVKLGDVCETGAGGTPLKQNRAYYEGGTIPWLRSGEVCRKDITETEMFITQLGMDCSSAKLFPVGSVLVAMYGATAGQVGILRISATTNQAICAILPTNKVIPEFLYYQLLGLKDEMVSQAQGGAQPNISQEKVRGLLILVPQKDVQQRVVSDLDAAKSKSERMVVAARRCIGICGKMRKAILAEAFQ